MIFHHKTQDITRLPTPETMKSLRTGVDSKRGGLLTVKRAQAKIPRTAFFQINMTTDNLYDIRLFLDTSNNIFPG